MTARRIVLMMCALFVFPVQNHSFGQWEREQQSITWGEVPVADLSFTTFPPDTNAEAVVLFDDGESVMNDHMGFVFRRHRRIKILSAAGYTWGTHSITLHTDDSRQKMGKVQGCTYTLGSDGNVVRSPLDEESVFSEDYDEKYTRYTFTLPSLAPGCVIEYRYSYVTNGLNGPRDWEFQTTIPVRWSEYRFKFPARISYAIVALGYEPFFVKEVTESTQHFDGESRLFLNNSLPSCKQYRWVVRGAPALREEPYITTLDDYAARIMIQLAAYAIPNGGGVKDVLKDWPTVINELLKDDHVGGFVEVPGPVRRLSERVTNGILKPEDKMTALYDHIRRSFVWSGLNKWYPQQDIDDLIESRTGTSGELGLLLVSMLRASGIEAYPVLLSTRSHGRLLDIYPMMQQFNSAIAMARIGGAATFLDPTDPLRPVDLLPVDVLNVRGLVLKEGEVEWVTITSPQKYMHTSLVRMNVSPSGELTGVMESSDAGYSGFQKRRDLAKKKDTDIAKELLDADESGLSIDSAAVKGKDSVAAPLRLRTMFSSATYAQTGGDMIYINPAVVHRIRDNPFRLKVRRFPVDMAYARRISTFTSVTIPEGYEVQELPPERCAGLMIDAANDEAEYSRHVEVEGNAVQVRSTFSIGRIEFPPNRYDRLKQFYNRVSSYSGDQIVLRRKPPSQTSQRKPKENRPEGAQP